MRKIFYVVLSVLLVAITSCSKYDDSELKDRLDDHENRIQAIETILVTVNSQIGSIQNLLNTIQQGDWITSVTPTTDGYTINFAKGSPIVIKNGTNGTNGSDGANGSNGVDGSTPVMGIGVSGGVYYWNVTQNGITNWITDSEGNKIPTTGVNGSNGANGTNGTNGAPGTDGSDGITPQFQIAGGKWEVSYDNGMTWIVLGVATGSDGANGSNGSNGATPIFQYNAETGELFVHFGDEKWELVGNIKGENGADGNDGTNGSNGSNGIDGITPEFKVEGENLWVSFDKSSTWKDLGSIKGDKGEKGETGFAPVLGVDAAGYWTIITSEGGTATRLKDINNNDVLAKVTDTPFSLETAVIGSYLQFTFHDESGTVIRVPFVQPFDISVTEAVEFVILTPAAGLSETFTVVMKHVNQSNYLSLRADVQGRAGNASDVHTRAVGAGWDVEVGAPTFTAGQAQTTLKITSPLSTPTGSSYDNANLTLTVLGRDGRTSTATFVLKVGANQLLHILPNDPNFVNGVYTIPSNSIASGAGMITLAFDDKNYAPSDFAKNLTIVIPDGFDLPIDVDFDLVVNKNINLSIASQEYREVIRLIDSHLTSTSVKLESLDINLPSSSLHIMENYVITGTSNIVTGSGTFTLDKKSSMNNLFVKGGRALIFGELTTLDVSGVGTEVFIDNSKVSKFWFKSSDISNFNTSNGFQGFDVMQLLGRIDIAILGEVLTAISNSGLIDLGGLDLDGLFNGTGGIDLGFLTELLNLKFYYAGAATNFDNPYVKANFSSLKGVEYNLLSGTSRYTASLPKAGLTTLPVLKQLNNFKEGTNPFAKQFGIDPSMANIVPTFYAASDNFSMQGIIDLLDMYYSIVALVEVIESIGAVEYIQSLYDGTLWSVKYGITNPIVLANIPRRENYPSGTIGTIQYNGACVSWAAAAGVSTNQIVAIIADMAMKSVVDAAIGAFVEDLDPEVIVAVMGSLTEITALLETVTPMIETIYKPIKEVDAFLNSLKSHNPWSYSGGLKSTDKFTGLEAAFSINANGLPVVINNSYTK